MRGPSDKPESKRAGAKLGETLSSARIRRKGDALPFPEQHERVAVESHRELLAMARVLAPRLASNPEFSVMLLANPVLALEHYGIALSKDMQHHVLETLRHPPRLRERRRALEKSLEAALGERAKPNDTRWMARLVFELRGLEPFTTSGAEPRYRSPLAAATIERLERLRPPATRRYARARSSATAAPAGASAALARASAGTPAGAASGAPAGAASGAPAGEVGSTPPRASRGLRASIGIAARRPTVRLLALDAPPPRDLPRAKQAPSELTLEEAWFYKDDPLVRDAVELGQIERRAFPFRTPAEFRDLAAGKKLDAFGAYVRAIRIPGAEP